MNQFLLPVRYQLPPIMNYAFCSACTSSAPATFHMIDIANGIWRRVWVVVEMEIPCKQCVCLLLLRTWCCLRRCILWKATATCRTCFGNCLVFFFVTETRWQSCLSFVSWCTCELWHGMANCVYSINIMCSVNSKNSHTEELTTIICIHFGPKSHRGNLGGCLMRRIPNHHARRIPSFE